MTSPTFKKNPKTVYIGQLKMMSLQAVMYVKVRLFTSVFPEA